MKAVVWIGHGSRSTEGNESFIAFIQKVMEQTHMPLSAYGFLEKARPSMTEAIHSCIEKGASEILVMPVLLMPGIHANEDIPNKLNELRETYPDILFLYGKPIGVDVRIVDIVIDRLNAKGFNPEQGHTVLLVGHGSRENSAATELNILATGLQRRISSAVHTSFITMAPHYAEKAEELLSTQSKIFLVPHLLFTGGFVERMKKLTSSSIVVCEPTGFDERLVELLLIRMQETVGND